MSLKILAHNWLAHPLAGLLWYVAEKLASPTLEALGSMIHEAWAQSESEPTEHERERWQAEFNLIFYSDGMWTASEVAEMSDEKLVALLLALVDARQNEAKRASCYVDAQSVGDAIVRQIDSLSIRPDFLHGGYELKVKKHGHSK